jgi:hypothetical protein
MIPSVAVAGPPHCAGRLATGRSRQLTKAWTVTRAACVPVVSGAAISTGIFTLSGGCVAGTSMTGGTVMATATPRHSWFWQVDVSVAGSPSSQGSPSGFCVSAGQVTPVPLQLAG